MIKYPYLILIPLCLGGGAYAWQVKNSGFSASLLDVSASANAAKDQRGSPWADAEPPLQIEVGHERISQEDIAWEYDLLTADMGDQDTMTSFPDLGPHQPGTLAPLKQALIATLIERKLLFAFVQKDADFHFDNAARYVDCMRDWQAAVQAPGAPELLRANRDRLKSRLCERSILSQYIHERLLPNLRVAESEVVEYYKNHLAEFRIPERARVRHMLLGSEADARKWRAQVNARNFDVLARQNSLAPEASRGGLLGPFAKGAMPPVFEVAFHLQKGEISDVLKSNYGYHIIMLVDREPRQETSLERARPKILASLRRRQEEEAYGKLVEQALTTITVKTPQKIF